MFVKLKKGDQIIAKSNHKTIKIDSPKAKKFKGLKSILRDINFIEYSIKRFIINPSNEYEHFIALIITYRKCFSDSKGRHAKLEKQRDLKGADQKSLDLHERIIEIGNKHIAHAEATLYDQNITVLILDKEQKAIGIEVLNMMLVNFTIDDYKKWLTLLKILKSNVDINIKKISFSIINEYNSSLWQYRNTFIDICSSRLQKMFSKQKMTNQKL